MLHKRRRRSSLICTAILNWCAAHNSVDVQTIILCHVHQPSAYLTLLVCVQICQGQLTEPLAWAVKHRTALRKDGAPSPLEFKLQRLLFLKTLEQYGTMPCSNMSCVPLQCPIQCYLPQHPRESVYMRVINALGLMPPLALQSSAPSLKKHPWPITFQVHAGVTEALQYAQVHLQQFKGEFMPQIKQLMGRLLYSHRPLGVTPYGHLDEKALLEEVATDFTKATCRILGQVCFLV